MGLLRTTLIAIAISTVILGLLPGLFYVVKSISNGTPPIRTYEVRKVEPGIKCAVVVTSGGSAMDCWKY